MEYETLILYYTCWHDGEFSLSEMRRLLIDELGEDGLRISVEEFRKHRLERIANGECRIYYEVMKDEENGQNQISKDDEPAVERE